MTQVSANHSGSSAGRVLVRRRSGCRRLATVVAVALAVATVIVGGSTSAAAAPPAVPQIAAAPSLGAGVYVFDPSMPQEQIQQTVDAVAAQQVDAEFGAGRYALLFKPGSYGTRG